MWPCSGRVARGSLNEACPGLVKPARRHSSRPRWAQTSLFLFTSACDVQTSLTRALTQTLTLTLTLALTLTLLWTQARKQDLGLCAAGAAPRVTTPEQGWPDSAPTLTPDPNPNPSPVTRALTFRPGAGRPRHSGCQPGARTARRKPQLPGDPDPNPSL